LTWVVFLINFFNWFFFQFHASTLDCLEIKLCNLFLFFSIRVVLISLPESRVWQVNPNWLCLLFRSLLIEYFLIGLHDYYFLLFMKLSQSHDPGCRFDKLTQIDSIFFVLNLILQQLISNNNSFFFKEYNLLSITC
jgi:hypothetical protein